MIFLENDQEFDFFKCTFLKKADDIMGLAYIITSLSDENREKEG